MSFIHGRITQEINKKEEYYSNEARYWRDRPTQQMHTLYEEIIQRARQKAGAWRDLREKINNNWRAFSPMYDVKAAYEVYLERVAFALSLVGGETDELARLLFDLYTVGYIFKNVIHNPNKRWGENPGEGLWDGQMVTEWRNYKELWYKIGRILRQNPNESKDGLFRLLSDEVSRTINDEKREYQQDSGRTKVNKEIYIVFLGVYERLVDFYRRHTTYSFHDFNRVVGHLYENQDRRDFEQHLNFILRRIMQEINKKQEYHSNEARYWQNHYATRQLTSTLPQELAHNVWTHVREDITEDQETRALNTPHFLRLPYDPP